MHLRRFTSTASSLRRFFCYNHFMKITYKRSATLILLGAISFALYLISPVFVDIDGTLVEPFALIPLGYILVALGAGSFIVAKFSNTR